VTRSKLLALAATAAVLVALTVLWLLAAGARDVARAERDRARAEVTRLDRELAGERAGRASERERCRVQAERCNSDVEVRDAILREWSGHLPRGTAGRLLDRLLSAPGSCDLDDDLLPPAVASDGGGGPQPGGR
jgi:hypothetical protein